MRILRFCGFFRLIKLWVAGRGVIPFSALACLFACLGSSLANQLVLSGRVQSIQEFVVRFGVGYAGAVLVGCAALPILNALLRNLRQDDA